MKYLGIDYGTKRIGFAVSSDDGSIAFPREVIENKGSDNVRKSIEQFVEQENIDTIVIGESKDRDGNDNAIMEDVRDLIGQLSLTLAIPIEMQREDFTSSAARQPLVAEKNVARSRAKKNTDSNDARAAALILQRYLDRQKK